MNPEQNPFTNPNEGQRMALEQFNRAVLWLALTFGVNEDALEQRVGPYTEEVISVLLDQRHGDAA